MRRYSSVLIIRVRQGLISALKTHFTTFGISIEIASDEGLGHTASATKRFLTDWDVKHRPYSV